MAVVVVSLLTVSVTLAMILPQQPWPRSQDTQSEPKEPMRPNDASTVGGTTINASHTPSRVPASMDDSLDGFNATASTFSWPRFGTTNALSSPTNSSRFLRSGGRASSSTCACQPAEWEFTLHLARGPCGDTNVPTAHSKLSGLASILCTTTPAHGGQFEVVDFVQIHEYNRHNRLLNPNSKPMRFTGPYMGATGTAATIYYASVLYMTNAQTGHLNYKHVCNSQADGGDCMPTSLQIHLYGKNYAKENLQFQWTLTFTNDCTVYPVEIVPGHYMGPVQVVRVKLVGVWIPDSERLFSNTVTLLLFFFWFVSFDGLGFVAIPISVVQTVLQKRVGNAVPAFCPKALNVKGNWR